MPILQPFSWVMMIEAVQAVRERLLRSAAALREAGIPYAIIGGNAVAAWVARIDKAAVRNTQDVDILIRRCDVDAVRLALEGVGFHQVEQSPHCFIDGPKASQRDAVHLVFADDWPNLFGSITPATVLDAIDAEGYRVLSLEALVRMKLQSFRIKDCMHLRDLLDIGLIDSSWLQKLIPEHAARLQELIDDPDG